MAKVKYKEISQALSKLTKPDAINSRMSIGLEKNIGEYYYLPVEDLLPFKNQAREHFDAEAINNLAASIKQHGIRQPLTVIASEVQKGKFEVVSGERRLRAAKVINMEKVPCFIIKDSELAEEIAVIENLHREDLHPIELGTAFNSLLKNKIFDSQAELANALAVNKSMISECLQYYELPLEIKRKIIEHNIRSRDKLRKIVQYRDNAEVIQDLLGEKKAKAPSPSLSVIRIALQEGVFKFQLNGLKKLDAANKARLKEELKDIVSQL